ncbi:MAG: hypothetical protein MRZ75_08410 [Roseburia sp.]|uniref:hypothetical protein n=1 Tax=Roseburia sp. 831b TaxID=1261635 RepID=UPI000951CAEF|nr:hypothetical protein [Roseburia sp. 831b]MCI5919327.1 hypothetical protein [Roseburia sp.]MDY5883391.1 hypothetical protein [Roseburia sp.]WVK72497.1 hypothetical protein BIV16_12195 [Roseburia sp. 831b]
MVQAAYYIAIAGEIVLALLMLAVLHQIREIREEQKKKIACLREEFHHQERKMEPQKEEKERPKCEKETAITEPPEVLINEVLQEIFP